MYWRILKKDLKHKKTMNVILLVFIVIAAMFIASGTNNMVTIITALDKYFEKAGVPDYWLVFNDEDSKKEYKNFAGSNNYNCKFNEMIYAKTDDIQIDGRKIDYSNILCIETLDNPLNIFDSSDNEIKDVADGEIYVTASLFNSERNNLQPGSKITVSVNNRTKVFTARDYTKDAICSPSMVGMSKFIVSENDYNYLKEGQPELLYGCFVYTDDKDYIEKVSKVTFNSMIKADINTMRMMYVMEMVNAAAVLIVSICIILISMVILRFTINFTMSGEFRETGVMKAIGIKNSNIRVLYIIKYLAVSIAGASIGFIASIPFGNLLLESVSSNIIISNDGSYIINFLCAVLTVVMVVLFCYLCTRRIKRFSPVDAIRNGETGERYLRKGVIYLSRLNLPPVVFMALNDILSGIRRYISMIITFTLGILLVVIPVNTINTLQSDQLIEWFSMAGCDHVISHDMLLSRDGRELETLDKELSRVKNQLKNNNIDAMVFQEINFRANIIFDGKKAEVMMLQGTGGVTTNMYSYIEGTPPGSCGEIAISNVVANEIGANIGDNVEVTVGGETKTYIITAINQSMQNMGEGIRAFQDEKLDYTGIAGVLGIQVKYKDNPGSSELSKRKKLLEKLYPGNKVYTAGGYIAAMTGDIGGQIKSIKNLILIVVICINVLVTVLMVKSFITKEKGEIAILKAIGFKSISLVCWQSLRIDIVLLISVILSMLLHAPLSQVFITPVFHMMGAYSIKFDIKVFEVYLFYPLLVLVTVSLAAFMASQGLRKVYTSQASNIE